MAELRKPWVKVKLSNWTEILAKSITVSQRYLSAATCMNRRRRL